MLFKSELPKLRAFRAHVPYVPTFLRALGAYVSVYFTCLCVFHCNVPK